MSDPDEAKRSPTWADRGWYLAIGFQQSSSSNFDYVLEQAGQHPGFCALLDEGGTCVYRVLAGPDDVYLLIELIELVRNWKDARFYLCGRLVEVEAVDAWLYCYEQQRRQENPTCRRGMRIAPVPGQIGCGYAGISLAMSDWDAWYGHGRFDAAGVYWIDKAKLQARIDSWERRYGGCPFADAALLRRVVDALPERINPRQDGRWRMERVYYLNELRLVPRSTAMYLAFLREYLGEAWKS